MLFRSLGAEVVGHDAADVVGLDESVEKGVVEHVATLSVRPWPGGRLRRGWSGVGGPASAVALIVGPLHQEVEFQLSEQHGPAFAQEVDGGR